MNHWQPLPSLSIWEHWSLLWWPRFEHHLVTDLNHSRRCEVTKSLLCFPPECRVFHHSQTSLYFSCLHEVSLLQGLCLEQSRVQLKNRSPLFWMLRRGFHRIAWLVNFCSICFADLQFYHSSFLGTLIPLGLIIPADSKAWWVAGDLAPVYRFIQGSCHVNVTSNWRSAALLPSFWDLWWLARARNSFGRPYWGQSSRVAFETSAGLSTSVC